MQKIKSIKKEYDSYVIDSQVSIVVDYFCDRLADDLLSREELIQVIKEAFLLKQTDNRGKDDMIFSYEDYSFDETSVIVMSKVIEELSALSESENFNNCVSILQELMSNDREKRDDIINSTSSAKKVRFVTIPIGDYSVLDYDTEFQCVECTFNGQKMKTSTPYDGEKTRLTDSSGTSGYKIYDILLARLNGIEEGLSTNPNIMDGRFRNERGYGFTNRDLTNKIRIHLSQFKETADEIVFIISGIFKKISDDRDMIFKEYGNRTKIVDNMVAEGVDVDLCEQAYLNFKKKLIKLKYDGKFNLAGEIFDLVSEEEMRL